MNVDDVLSQQTSIPIGPSDHVDEEEVKEIIESIKEAQYFDASSMAPLTPAASVSTLNAL